MPGKKLRLLVAVDFSPESRNACRAAQDLVRRTGGSIVLAHVRPYSDVAAAVAEDRGDLLKGKPGSLPAALESHYARQFASIAAKDSKTSYRLLRGKPSLELRREARRRYDFLVLGTRGRGRVAATLLGSTVQEILTRCPIPVLVVGPAWSV
jgi:nucleotide-binding universal stress UspA family protein